VKLAFSVSVTVIAPIVGPVLTLFTASPNVAFAPAVKLLVAVFTMARSGDALTLTVSVEELFAALLSPEVATVAVFVIFPDVVEGFTATVSVIFPAEAPLAIGPALVQVTTRPTLPQTQFVPVAETKLKLAFSVSDTVMAPEVGADPTLLTEMVKTPFVPAVKLPE
jgi:hypothetical protein